MQCNWKCEWTQLFQKDNQQWKTRNWTNESSSSIMLPKIRKDLNLILWPLREELRLFLKVDDVPHSGIWNENQRFWKQTTHDPII